MNTVFRLNKKNLTAILTALLMVYPYGSHSQHAAQFNTLQCHDRSHRRQNNARQRHNRHVRTSATVFCYEQQYTGGKTKK